VKSLYRNLWLSAGCSLLGTRWLLTQQVGEVGIGHWITVFKYDDQTPSKQAQDGHVMKQNFLLRKKACITDVGSKSLGILDLKEAITVQMLPCTAAFTIDLWRSAKSNHGAPRSLLAYHVAFFSVPLALTVNHLLGSISGVFILSSKLELLPPDFQLICFGLRQLDLGNVFWE